MPGKRRSLDEFIQGINRKLRENNGRAKPRQPSAPLRQTRPARSLFDYLEPARPRRPPKSRIEPPRTGDGGDGSSQGRRAEPAAQPPTATPVPAREERPPEPEAAPKQREPRRRAAPEASVVGRPREGGSWRLGDIDNYVEEAEGYLLDVRYEGRLGRAVAFLLSSDGRLVRWADRTGHKPYFLTDAPIEELASPKIGVSRHKSFARFEVVSKTHPIKREKVTLTKIVVDDPLAVRELRERVAEAGYHYWEADIKYHHNYVFDHRLVPGMVYHASRAGWRRERVIEPERVEELISRVFSDETEEFKEMAREWIPVFEQPPPSPDRVSIDIEVYAPQEGELPDPGQAPYPVISIALADNRGMRKVLLLAREDVEPGDLSGVDAEIELFPDEASMILEALRIISRYPVVLTFNGDNFDLPYLYNRLLMLGFEPQRIPIEFKQDHVTITYQLHVDLHRLFDIRALQTYAFGNAYREKSLDAVAAALLGKAKEAIEKPISELRLADLASYNATDAALTVELTTFADNLVWNLVVLLMRISKLGLEDVTRTQVSGWIKSLMNWEHRRLGYLIPSREEIAAYANVTRSTAVIKDKKYKGAIVLEPPQGVFFNILVLDFASLYPSIIKNWNLSYETVNNPYCKGEKLRVPEVGHEVCMSIRGISSLIVGLLKDFRVRIYKKRAKDKSLPESERLWYNTVQAAMKVYVNASYGVFGTESFHLYSLAVAESVTAIGRTVLKSTKRKAEELDLMILYGDTDSIFIWDPPEEKLEEIISYVKREFGLDLEKDKEFRIGLFSGLKKNYIGVDPEGGVVIKGMVGKKSNTPEFIKKEFSDAVRMLADIQEPRDVPAILDRLRDHVASIYAKLKRREYTLDELAIRVMLSKDPKEYKKNTPQHVKAALILRKHGVPVGKGTIVSYVKTRDKVGVKPVRLAKLSEVDTGKYQEYVRTVFEQMLMAFGVRWDRMHAGIGIRSFF